MESWCLYKHTSPSGKVYIGISKNVNIRWSGNGCRYLIYNSIFGKAILKYGWNNIKHEVLISGLSRDKANELEIKFIRYYKSLGISYNITDGGEGTTNRILSEETKAKMRASARGWSREAIEASIAARKGTNYYKESIQKAHNAWRGSHHSEATKRKLSNMAKGRDMSKAIEANRRAIYDRGKGKRKPIIQYDLDGNALREFPSATDAMLFLNKNSKSISNCLAGRSSSAFGYKWKYK
jgi:group I intron endonuclease